MNYSLRLHETLHFKNITESFHKTRHSKFQYTILYSISVSHFNLRARMTRWFFNNSQLVRKKKRNNENSWIPSNNNKRWTVLLLYFAPKRLFFYRFLLYNFETVKKNPLTFFSDDIYTIYRVAHRVSTDFSEITKGK